MLVDDLLTEDDDDVSACGFQVDRFFSVGRFDDAGGMPSGRREEDVVVAVAEDDLEKSPKTDNTILNNLHGYDHGENLERQ